MGWLSKIFSSAGGNLVDSVGKVVDDLVTSDEEIALTEIQKLKIKSAYNVRMQELLAQLDQQAVQHEARLESELTQRLKMDMKSDSWLSKNIRPMTLIFMTLVVSVLAFCTIFNDSFTPTQLETIQAWIPFFQTIMLTIYAFYFGSRGLEKVQKMRSAAAQPQLKINPLEQEPKG